MKQYYRELTLMKGIGILFVLLGHSFSFTGFDLIEKNTFNLYVFKTIYSFHMPLFFIIAGFLSNNYKDNLNKKFYISKIKRLLLPYICINILDAIPRYFFQNLVNNKSNSIEKVIFYSGTASWFVYSLFILFLIFPIVEKYIIKKDKYYLLGITLFILNLFGVGSNIHLFTINELVYMSFYFYIGYLIKKNYQNYCKFVLKNYNYLLVIVLLFFMIGYKYDTYNLNKILYPFLGIISTFLLVLKIKENKKKLINFIYFCGENSLTFYLLEVFCGAVYRVILIKIIPIDYNGLLIGSFFFLKLITLYIGIKYILTKNYLLSIIFGAKYDNKNINIIKKELLSQKDSNFLTNKNY